MKIGTKSVLYGAHCFLVHPICIFIAWWKLYGFPFDPRLWVAFFVHDLGYLGKPNMDGPEGETHVELGARIMHKLFDWKKVAGSPYYDLKTGKPVIVYRDIWGNFSMYHSRFYAKKDGVIPSKLCMADKLAICYDPTWFYLLRVNMTGEVKEYMKDSRVREGKEPLNNQWQWIKRVKKYMRDYVDEHKDGREDTWTPETKQPMNAEGVWK